MKKIGFITLLFFCVSNVFGQSKITYLVDLIKGLDKSWTLKVDTSRINQRSLTISGQNIGFLIFTKGKEEITFCVYRPTKNNIDSSIKQFQKLASCSSIGETEKNQIVRRNDLVIFLSIYPCWTGYSDDGKKLIEKVFTKLRSYLLTFKLPKNGSTAHNIGFYASWARLCNISYLQIQASVPADE